MNAYELDVLRWKFCLFGFLDMWSTLHSDSGIIISDADLLLFENKITMALVAQPAVIHQTQRYDTRRQNTNCHSEENIILPTERTEYILQS